MGDAGVAVEDEEQLDELVHERELVGPGAVGAQGGDEVAEAIVGDCDKGCEDEVDGVEQLNWLGGHERLLDCHDSE